MDLLEGFNIFKNGIDNWFCVIINMLILKRESICKIKNLGNVKLKKGVNYLDNSLFRALIFSQSKDLSYEQINILKTYINQIDNDVIEVINYEDGNKFNFLNKEISLIFESFLYGDYRNIPNSNKSIIDIEANVGDSAIYFANKGYDVYAFEPLPHISKIANKNINMNPKVQDKITFVNKAVSCKKGKIEIYFDENDTGGLVNLIKVNLKLRLIQ